MVSSIGFFDELTAFTSFEDVNDLQNYHAAPDDWYVIVTDIKGSTKAIENGRYKDVNMVGAACIAAAVNACSDIKIPYVFGGDGATFLVPPAYLDQVTDELIGVRHYAELYHDLSLRLGAVPVSEIHSRGKQCLVAKYRIETGAVLAMFDGGGVSMADRIVKEGLFNIGDEAEKIYSPNLEGLSCRWHPVQNDKGIMLTLMVMVTNKGAHQNEVYKRITKEIYGLLDGQVHPVHQANMRYKWPTLETLKHSQMTWRGPKAIQNLLHQIFLILLANTLERFDLKLKKLDWPEYRTAMLANTDYRKFDDVLRMVVDCTPDQADQIDTLLNRMFMENKIVFGTHRSDDALITCFVQTLNDDGHVHFIDGGSGGYALAAKDMKERMQLI